MKAVLFRRHGGPDVLDYADVPDPELTPGHVLIRVKACSINHLDIWLRQGIPAYHTPLPHISGCDISGVVEQVGTGVTAVAVGERVVLAPGLSCGECDRCRAGQDTLCRAYGIRGAAVPGGYAQLHVARAEAAIPIPESLSFEAAAAFPLVFLTAWHMVVGRAQLRTGETVLVHAAGSGVGHAAVQIAKHLKATVYTTVGSKAKIPKAEALGADAVIDYRQESFEERVRALTDGRGVDLVVDHVGPQVWEGSLRLLAKGGRLVTCGATTGPSVPLDLRYLFSRQLSVLGSMMGTRAELDAIVPLIATKALRPVVDTIFPLREARAAQERMLARDVFGKLILVPDGA